MSYTLKHKRRSMLISIALILTALTILSATGCALFEHMESVGEAYNYAKTGTDNLNQSNYDQAIAEYTQGIEACLGIIDLLSVPICSMVLEGHMRQKATMTKQWTGIEKR